MWKARTLLTYIILSRYLYRYLLFLAVVESNSVSHEKTSFAQPKELVWTRLKKGTWQGALCACSPCRSLYHLQKETQTSS